MGVGWFFVCVLITFRFQVRLLDRTLGIRQVRSPMGLGIGNNLTLPYFQFISKIRGGISTRHAFLESALVSDFIVVFTDVFIPDI